VDAVDLEICLPFKIEQIISSDNTDLYQVASGTSIDHQKLLIISVLPYGLKTPDSSFPAALQGNKQRVKDVLIPEYLGFQTFDGPEVKLFDKQESSTYSIIFNSQDSVQSSKVLTILWVTEAGNRIWIIRIELNYPLETNDAVILNDLNTFSSLSLSSTNLYNGSISLRNSQLSKQSGSVQNIPISPLADLPIPSWWSGDCNVSNHPGSYPLGASYRGVKACGPLGSAVPVNFGVGATQLEWQCAELSKRYLYLAYGIAPYSAHGKDVVNNYSGTLLVKISNGTIGKAPQAGDVISYSGPDPNFGHTSIVSSSSVDGNGNGSITVIEQNMSAGGSRTHTVSNWYVQSSFNITNWLHEPAQDKPSGYEFCANEGGRCDFSGSASIAFGANGSYVYRTLSDGTDCNTSVFGDPIFGTQKKCYIKGGGPVGYTFCANEGQRCSFSGTANVAYGASLKYYYRNDVSGGIDCNNSTFGGDPVYGTAKSCYYHTGTPPSGTWSAKYYEGQQRWWDNTYTGNLKCTETLYSADINKDYGTGAPCAGMNPDQWVGDYTATLNFQSGNYVFWVDHDDGLKLWLNGTNIADRGNSGSTWVCPARYLSGNQNLWAMLREDGGSAKIILRWGTDPSVCDPPYAFSKALPYDGSTGVPSNPTLSWTYSTKSDRYEYCIDTINNNACDTTWVNAQTVTSISISGLTAGAQYYWQVRAVSAYGTTPADGGNWWSFVTQVNPPSSFGKNSPSNGNQGASTSPTLSWNPSSGASSYEYCYDTINDNSCNSTWTLIGNGSSVAISGLSAGTTYYWQVRSLNNGGTTYADGGTWWSFTVQGAPPGAFSKENPTTGTFEIPTTPPITWFSASGASSYEYCYDTTNDNVCNTSWLSTGTNIYVNLNGLGQNTNYYWQVRAINSSGITYANSGSWWGFKTWSSLTNLLMNGSFEAGRSFPSIWSTDSWNVGAIFSWDTAQKYTGNRSIKITLLSPNDARFIQTVPVQPNTNYRLSGWIKTEGVAHSTEVNDAGANFSILEDYNSYTTSLTGTNGWTYRALSINSGSRTTITVAARLGFYSGTTTGTAWFDDIKLEAISPPVTQNKFYMPLINK